MKKIVSIMAMLIGLAIIGYFAYPFVTSSIAKTVDLEVAKMVDRENSNLPAQIEPGVILEIIQNNPDDRQLTFRYKFQQTVPENRFSEITQRTNRRVLEDKNIVRALNNDIKVSHQFSDPNGRIVLDFETKK